MTISKDMITVKDAVEHLLKTYPVLRDNDTLLHLAYLNIYHGLKNKIGQTNYTILKTLLMNENTPKFASIIRVRAKFQEHGLYQGTVRAQRLEEAENVRDTINDWRE